MGGHGGLNILPQKRWNVYRYDNREKVRRDEEAAARDDQLKREQTHRRDAEFRLDRLRQTRGLPPPSSSSSAAAPAPAPDPVPAVSNDSLHFNLFDGVGDFSSLVGAPQEADARAGKRFGKQESEDGGSGSKKRRRVEEKETRVVTPEDEKYKLGYGLAGKGVKAPWYLSRPSEAEASPETRDEEAGRSRGSDGSRNSKNVGKKTMEQLREERMRRERQERERERAILGSKEKKKADRGYSRRYNECK